MRRPVGLFSAVLGSLAIAVGAGAGIAAAKPKKVLKLDLCSIAGAQVASAEVSAPCVQSKTGVAPLKKNPLGGASGLVTYGAHWGVPASGATPEHYASIIVTHVRGSGKGLELALSLLRGKVLSHGAPVGIAGGTASQLTEAFACVNPPTEQCVTGSFLAIKGRWVVEAFLNNNPPTGPGEMEEELAAAEAAAKQTEELMKPQLEAIGKAVLAQV